MDAKLLPYEIVLRMDEQRKLEGWVTKWIRFDPSFLWFGGSPLGAPFPYIAEAAMQAFFEAGTWPTIVCRKPRKDFVLDPQIMFIGPRKTSWNSYPTNLETLIRAVITLTDDELFDYVTGRYHEHLHGL